MHKPWPLLGRAEEFDVVRRAGDTTPSATGYVLTGIAIFDGLAVLGIRYSIIAGARVARAFSSSAHLSAAGAAAGLINMVAHR